MMKSMLKTVFFSLLLGAALITSSCDRAIPAEDLVGTYSGYFQRDGVQGPVELIFDGTHYSGSADVGRFPALCDGTYEVQGSTITFSNECVWTADFDWTLILEGTWTMSGDAMQLKLTKDNGDEYILDKQ